MDRLETGDGHRQKLRQGEPYVVRRAPFRLDEGDAAAGSSGQECLG
jgi:hypothetical protein